MEKEQLYNVYYGDLKLNTNTPPMTEKEADNYIGLVVINYGYKPEKRKHEHTK